MWEKFIRNSEQFEDKKSPYQDEGLLREYESAYNVFKEKINGLAPEVQEVLYAIYPTQDDIDGYMVHPIESLKEIVEEYTFTPNTMTDAAALVRVLQMKLNNLEE